MKRLLLPVLGVVILFTAACSDLVLLGVQATGYSLMEGSKVTPVGDGTLIVKYQGAIPDEKKWIEASRKACNGSEFTILNQQADNNPSGIKSYIGQIRCSAQSSSPVQTAQVTTKEQPPAGHTQQKQKELDRVEQLPTGANINVLGTFFSTNNRTEYVFDAPIDRVWMAVKMAARDFDKDARRPVVAIDERSNRVQNGKIDQMAMKTAGAWGPFVDEFVMEATRVSDAQTKITIVRTVMQRESGAGWGPQKSNEKIEKYLLTQIADNLKKLPLESTQSVTANEPPDKRDYAATAAAKYTRQGKPSDYMELDADKTFFVTQDGKSFAGTYRVNGNTLTLILPSGQAYRATFKGDTITDTDGIVWVKLAAAASVLDKR